MKFLSLVIVLSALLMPVVTPASVHACVWKVTHGGAPFPPCEVDDIPLRRRIDQLNTQLVGKVATVAQQIMWVRQEVQVWKRSWRQAKMWTRRFQSTYGRVTANPLPSMIAQYNRRAPLGRYLKLSANGDWAVSLDPVDFREIAADFLDRLKDREELARTYFAGLPDVIQTDVKDDYSWFRENAARRVNEMTEYEDYFEAASDSLRAAGDSLATRYADWATPDGLSEAKISRLSAILSRLRGTSVTAELRSLQARNQAVNTAIDRGERLRQLDLESAIPAF